MVMILTYPATLCHIRSASIMKRIAQITNTDFDSVDEIHSKSMNEIIR